MNVYLHRGKAKPAWLAHPWIYSGAVERVQGEARPGELAAVCDHQGTLIGYGHYNPEAQIAVRMWAFAPQGAAPDGPVPDARALLVERLHAAIARRRDLGLPSAETNAYRLVNSEGDRLPGLVIDIFDRVAVVAPGTPGGAALTDTVTAALRTALPRLQDVVVRTSPDASRLEGVPREAVGGEGSASRTVRIVENGLQLEVDVLAGQKTGFYLDQRDNRALLAGLARERDVLDVCAYTGAFGLAALRAGARSATAVESSSPALALARRNAEINGLTAYATVHDDVFNVLRAFVLEGRRFGIVVVDPPKFCRRRSDLDNATARYVRLNELALRCLTPDGFLATCSCSEHVDAELFQRIVAEAGLRAGSVVHVLEARGQPADHPVPAGFREGRYLKALLCQASPRF